jgi:PPOX class probable F420-dependent enzyme
LSTFTLSSDAWEQVFVKRQPVARLATIDPQGRPHIVPVVFALDRQRLFTPIDRKPKRVDPRQLQRVRNIQSTPEVTILFDEYHDDWSKLAWVQIRGLARFVEAGSERDIGIKLLAEKYSQYKNQSLADRPVIVITMESMISWQADVVKGAR